MGASRRGWRADEGGGTMIDGLLNPIHILILFFVVVVIFGPKRLPEMGRKIGQTLHQVNTATSEIRSQVGLDEIAGSVHDIKSTFSLTGLAGAQGPASKQDTPQAEGAAPVEAAAPPESQSTVAARLERPAVDDALDQRADGVEQFGKLARSSDSQT
jgi:TatA/E family protein of Tat protein translocase